jgi:hypothetical protein
LDSNSKPIVLYLTNSHNIWIIGNERYDIILGFFIK